MEEMKVFIVNLGKYTEGEETGEWFSLPLDWDNVKERLGLNKDYEEIAILSYDLPFRVSEHESIEELNKKYHLVKELPEEVQDNLEAILSLVEEIAEHVEDIIFYRGCNNMSDVACYLVEQKGLLNDVVDEIAKYFNYEAYGRDLEITGRFCCVKGGMCQLNWI